MTALAPDELSPLGSTANQNPSSCYVGRRSLVQITIAHFYSYTSVAQSTPSNFTLTVLLAGRLADSLVLVILGHERETAQPIPPIAGRTLTTLATRS